MIPFTRSPNGALLGILGALGSLMVAYEITAIIPDIYFFILTSGLIGVFVTFLILYGIGEAIECACKQRNKEDK